MSSYNVAILGATGVVGQELVQILMERRFPVAKLRLLASARSAGRELTVDGEKMVIEEVTPQAFNGVDLAFFTAGASVSREFVDAARKAGTVVIDNTSAFRMDPAVPLVVPEVNAKDIHQHQGVIANPNCSTIIMVVPLKPLHDRAQIKRIVVSTYQAVSGAGAAAMDELVEQVKSYAAGRPLEAKALPYKSAPKHYQIAFNLLPHIDSFAEDGYTKEEWKMVNETQKIFGDKTIRVTATTVRVPVLRSHSESINVEFTKPISPEEAKALLADAPGVVLQDDPEAMEYPMPLDVADQDPVYVGRIRVDRTVPHGLNLWVVGDQIRKGAALNSVQIAEYMVANGLL
ncbi:MAG: aspartate-semialdehyde dehydrogenase [Firmicutes bacterium]|nr:aspartate-semialdehyde dehydrogenase [Bacillota bacterium]